MLQKATLEIGNIEVESPLVAEFLAGLPGAAGDTCLLLQASEDYLV